MHEHDGGRVGGAGAAGLFVWYWTPVLAYAGLIFALSSLSRPEEMMPSILEEVGDKTLHALEYGVFGVLCYRALRGAAGAWAAARALPLAVLAALSYGLTDEVHQAFVPRREADAWDLVADGTGALLLTWAWHLIREKGSGQRAKEEGREASG